MPDKRVRLWSLSLGPRAKGGPARPPPSLKKEDEKKKKGKERKKEKEETRDGRRDFYYSWYKIDLMRVDSWDTR